jgi:protein-S-isoprenylcysteine O-methyltransferase Ste14
MHALELRIPPPVVALLIGCAMWWLAAFLPTVPLPDGPRRLAALVVFGVGLGFDLAGLVAFFKAGTTINPLSPRRTTALVTGGVYRFTRNPMYVGLALVLVAWAVLQSSVPAFLGPVAFVLYITRFQIAPEERVLSQVFGEEFRRYAARVPRWL